MIFVCLVFLIFSGCSHETLPNSTARQRSATFTDTGTLANFVKLLTERIGTSGTLSSDFSDSVEYVAVSRIPLREGSFLTADNLNLLLESAYRNSRSFYVTADARKAWKEKYPEIPLGIPRTLLIFRFISTASKIDKIRQSDNLALPNLSPTEKAASSYLELADRILSESSFRDFIESFRREYYPNLNSRTFRLLAKICEDMTLDPDCPSYAWDTYLGIFGSALFVEKLDTKLLKISIVFISATLNQYRTPTCQSQPIKEKIAKKILKTFATFKMIISAPSSVVIASSNPLEEQMKLLNIELRKLDEIAIPFC